MGVNEQEGMSGHSKPSAILYFFCTRGRSPMTPAWRSWRLRFVFMCAFRWRRPTFAYFSLPVAVTRTRFLTLLFVLFLVAIGPILRARERRAKSPPTWL